MKPRNDQGMEKNKTAPSDRPLATSRFCTDGASFWYETLLNVYVENYALCGPLRISVSAALENQ